MTNYVRRSSALVFVVFGIIAYLLQQEGRSVILDDNPKDQVLEANVSDLSMPKIQHHYSHIKVCNFAYQRTALSTRNGPPADSDILSNSTDLAVIWPAKETVDTAIAAGARTQFLAYRIATQLPPYSVADWLIYADRNGHDREDGFFHTSQPWPFRPPLMGFSIDGFPVRWWWDAQAVRHGVRSNLFNHFNHFDNVLPNPTYFTDRVPLSGDAHLGQSVVPVTTTSPFFVNQSVLLKDHSGKQESAVIESVQSGTSLTMRSELTHTYTTANAAAVGSTVTLGQAIGDYICWGYSDPFDRIEFEFETPRLGGWTAVLEYPTAVDKNGLPTVWSPLTIVTDSTKGFTQDGVLRWFPIRNPRWVPCVLSRGGTGAFRPTSFGETKNPYPICGYYVRLRTTKMGTAPVVSAARGHDYTGQGDSCNPLTMPFFNATADSNGDGYLSDAECHSAGIALDEPKSPNYLARFRWQSRLGTYGGGNVLWANYTNQNMRAWLSDFLLRSISLSSAWDGVFLDNSAVATLPNVLELGDYPAAYGKALNAAWRALPRGRHGPRFLMLNMGPTGGSQEIVSQCPSVYFETMLRDTTGWDDFEKIIGIVNATKGYHNPPPIQIVDAYCSATITPTNRDRICLLSGYYCLATADTYFGCFSANTTTSPWYPSKWFAAVAVNVGQPTGEHTVFASGKDPADDTKTYKVYRRDFDNAIVLYKPISHGRSGHGTNVDSSATTHDLDDDYHPLNADGTRGAATATIKLRNEEGAILMRSAR